MLNVCNVQNKLVCVFSYILNIVLYNFHIRSVHLDIIKVYLFTN